MNAPLRILVVGPDHVDSFARSIAEAFRRAGCEVGQYAEEDGFPLARRSQLMRFFWTRVWRLVPAIERGINERLLRKVRRVRPDAVLIVYNTFTPATIRAIRRDSDAITINWFPDAVSNFDRQYILASNYHLLFFKDHFIVRFVRDKLGVAECHFLPHACDARLHVPVELTDEDRRVYGCDLTTAANLYPYRARMLEPFVDYDMKIWGRVPRWLDSPLRGKATGRPVYGLDKSRAFRAAKIVLNTMHYAEIEGVNQRTFDAAGCGAFQITDDNPALPELFEPGREIVTYRTGAELKERVDYYLARPRERAEIAERACRRAHAEHTFDHRIAVILEHVRRLRGPTASPAAAPPHGGAGRV